MATASYPVHNSQGTARVRLYADGHAVVQAGATDLGTGTYTVMTQVAADSLGLPPEKIRFELGDTKLPTAPNSGGSVAAGTVSSSVYMAAQDVWEKLTKVAVHRPEIAPVPRQTGRSGGRKRPPSAESKTRTKAKTSRP